ncbi:hypothetical protein [Noviherbaspirillum denitrificans]|uniref:Uncharacterized protein n=1 Tax=Noviherbaspirillum denitrificans TaxID=1968433 RepID=A0A254TBY1_9BURK|nr:hypothetical protein [Noviherbaspirillum denitrificans]OWW20151.1 hypothetical protein AYR66_12245 [Noviherbaspirillum denitrificans]
MSAAEMSPLAHEWTTLQNNYEQYEKHSLLIKLASIALFVLSLSSLDAKFAVAVTLILWIQEGILRTYQSRLGDRLLRIEQLLKQASPQLAYACQLHTEWQAMRPGFGGLLVEYAKSMMRPTVAFPYVVLALLNIGREIFN